MSKTKAAQDILWDLTKYLDRPATPQHKRKPAIVVSGNVRYYLAGGPAVWDDSKNSAFVFDSPGDAVEFCRRHDSLAQCSVESLLAMAQKDPLIKATEKAYWGSNQQKLDQLLAQRRKWQSKVTRYQNLLAETDEEIRQWLTGLVAKDPSSRADLEFRKGAE